jgi:hypothetical protein
MQNLKGNVDLLIMSNDGWSPITWKLWFPFLNWPTTSNAKVKTFDDDDWCTEEELRELTDEEWETKIHPSAKFVLKFKFDERAIVGGDLRTWPLRGTDMWIERTEQFSEDTTVREFVERIYKYPGYGIFEGITPLGNNEYVFMWGT